MTSSAQTIRTSAGSASHISARPPATPASMRSSRERCSRSPMSAASVGVEGQVRRVALDLEVDERAWRGPLSRPDVTVAIEVAVVEVVRERELLLDPDAQLDVGRHAHLELPGVRGQLPLEVGPRANADAAGVDRHVRATDPSVSGIEAKISGVEVRLERIKRRTGQ